MQLHKLDDHRHRDARVIAGIDVEPGLLTHYAEIGLDEIGPAAADYPIFFMKDGNTGQLRLTALFGLAAGQNLYVSDKLWQASYLPIAVALAPFSLGGPDRAICLDEGHPRLTTDEGQRLFTPDGAETPYLAETRQLLGRLRSGMEQADRLIATLLEHGLLQPIEIILQLDNGETRELQGLYSIHAQRMAAIMPDALTQLHSQSLLGPIFTIIQSLNQMGRIRQYYNAVARPQIREINMSMQG